MWRRRSPALRGGVLLALAATLVFPALPGCGRARAGGEGGAVRLRFSIWGSYEEWAMWRALVSEFERRHPHIRIKIEYWPGNYETKLQLLMAADLLPDVMSVQDEPFQVYASRGKFRELEPFMRRHPGEFAPDLFLPTALESFRHRGRQMALPWNGGMILLFYNRQLLREAGLPDPPRDWTWADFLHYCQRLTRDDDGDGRLDRFGYDINNWWAYLMMWVWGAGGDFLNADRTRCTLHSSEAIEGLRFVRDLRFTHHVSPRAAEVAGMDSSVMFLTRRVAMYYNGPWQFPFLRQTSLDWDVAHLPIGPRGRWSRVSWDGLAMFARTRHPDEAWEFIRFATGDVGQERIARAGRAIPARRRIAESDAFVRPDTPQHEEVFLEAIDYMRLQPITLYWWEMDEVFRREVEKFLVLGIQSAEETARRMEEGFNRILQDPPR